MKKIIGILLLLSSVSPADIVCKATTSMGPATIKISDKQVSITGAALDKTEVYTKLDSAWDGHETGMITAPGLSISYEDWYGCIHNAKITANFRGSLSGSFNSGGMGFIESVEVAQCSGGSTPDEVCQVN